MDKKWFDQQFKNIEVPKNEVFTAIDKGMELGRKEMGKSKIKKSRIRIAAAISSTAAVVFLASGLFVSPIANVLAKAPLIGNIYTHFNDSVGRNLESQHLITQLNKNASYNGINVIITNAYYDGAIIGVTFNVDGNVKKDQNGDLTAFYEIFGGNEGISDSNEIIYMESTDKGYVGHLQLNYPKTQLPEKATVPLKFTSIGEEKGIWKFDVPIKQLPYKTITTDKESKSVDSQRKVHFDSIILGKASTTINYTATFPIDGKNDQVRLKIYDGKGIEVERMTDGIDLQTTRDGDQIIVKGRTIIPEPSEKLKGTTGYLEIYPVVALTGKDPNKPLELDSVKLSLNN